MTENTVTDGGVEVQYLIRKGGAYYRPNAAGYTTNIHEAGRYTLAEAIAHSHPNGPDGPRDGIAYYPAPAVGGGLESEFARALFESVDSAVHNDRRWFTEEAAKLALTIALSRATPAIADELRCSYCDGTGDVHRADGEWLGSCPCKGETPIAPVEREAGSGSHAEGPST